MKNECAKKREACRPLSCSEERTAFRAELRSARENCARDAEGYDQILFVIERLGSRLSGCTGTLGAYKFCLSELAKESDLLASSADPSGDGPPHFDSLFAVILEARNDALHQGSVARHLTSRAIELALILEDALASKTTRVEYLMVKDPVVANRWQTLGAIRQVMLANAFSYLPISLDGKTWHLVSDHSIAKHLLSGGAEYRKAELARPIMEVLKSNRRILTKAQTIPKETNACDAVSKIKNGIPVLVMDSVGAGKPRLVGLVSPADLL
jgi:hypothetical protein